MVDAEENQGTVIVGENPDGTSLNVQEQEQQESAYKTKARGMGWTNRQEWEASGKEPADWVPAREFLGRQSLFDKIHSLKNEIYQERRQHKTELESIKKYIAEMSETQYKKAVSDLKAQRREALSQGDVDTAETIQTQIEDTTQAHTELKKEQKVATQQETHPAVTEWIEKNPWFNSDQALGQKARAIAAGVVAVDPQAFIRDPEGFLKGVEADVKKLYPEKFSTTVRSTTSKVEGATTVKSKNTTVNGKKLELAWNDLSSDQQAIGKNVIGSGVLNDKAKKNGVSAREQYLLDMQDNLQRA